MTDEVRLQRSLDHNHEDHVLQGTHEASRSRTFQSREIIWSTFESLARELETSIDELINDAMATYARGRGYKLSAPPAGRHEPLEETREASSLSDLTASPSANTGNTVTGEFREESRTTPRRQPVRSLSSSMTPPPPPPPPPPGARGSARGPTPVIAKSDPRGPRSPGLSQPPLPPPRGPRMAGAGYRDGASVGPKRLVLTYQGQPFPVDKERFLIGRSAMQADLRLDDPNVSRQHAVIERVGAAWYIVDLGSTNGIKVAGERVARRALSDGDVIVITVHEVHCSLG